MKVKMSELTGPALDWAVAKCEGDFLPDGGVMLQTWPYYSSDWAQGGPIIEKEGIAISFYPEQLCLYSANWGAWVGAHSFHAPTPLVAAMRCYVTSKLGDEVEIPDQLFA